MNLCNKPSSRLLCTEPLEGRWLLSGIPSPSVADPPQGAVEVIEVKLASDDDGDDTTLAPSQLPQQVWAALFSRYPTAQLSEAEFSLEEGEAEYSVITQVNGKTLDLEFAADGKLIELAESLPSGDLPSAVVDWLRQNFPGARIDEAVTVTADGTRSYELLIAAPDGQQYEATLRVGDGQIAAEPLSDDAAREQVAALAATHSDGPLQSELSQPSTSEIESPPTAAAAAAAAEATLPVNDASQAFPLATVDISATAIALGPQSILNPDALQRVIADADPVVWLPQFAGTIASALPIDVAAMERELAEILKQIDALAAKIASGPTAAIASGTTRFTVVVALLVVAQLLVLNRRVPKGGPVLVFNATRSSWSWVLGSAPQQ